MFALTDNSLATKHFVFSVQHKNASRETWKSRREASGSSFLHIILLFIHPLYNPHTCPSIIVFNVIITYIFRDKGEKFNLTDAPSPTVLMMIEKVPPLQIAALLLAACLLSSDIVRNPILTSSSTSPPASSLCVQVSPCENGTGSISRPPSFFCVVLRRQRQTVTTIHPQSSRNNRARVSTNIIFYG